MTVKVIDAGANRVTRSIVSGNGDHVDVGVLGEAGGAAAHSQGENTVAQIAEFHELGLGVPRRSWLRGWIDANESQIASMVERLWAPVFGGERTHDQALKLLGVWIQGEIQKNIANGIAPPLADSTIAAKGSSTPLIDTGQLRSSIAHRVGSSTPISFQFSP